ncbi:TetR/AcrR family transcriptional regulator [Halomonas sp. MCCC 1A11062]|uniref:TetR/AcrR family transcriptional regulator n=1 Tax=Halomonas sp. MCCC 1A11062 TaxID=2733485 RepID=UPI001F16AB72|nr:TetR/AcrR family transcriptional regulator [Halomonas sp. MCCC 1A11062]MCE8038526.1 TetR/AcrR family transcriptional regulator [Halomonas sp. MCCC 1A11062]
MATQVSRRERLRQATLAEIREAARNLLIYKGTAAVTINAIAREVGMSGPAVYRYYESHDDLVSALTAEFYEELTADMKAAGAATSGTPGQRLIAMARAMRTWAVRHPAEFGWVFASPVPAVDIRNPESSRHQAGVAFGKTFLDQLVEVWETKPFAVPALDELDPSLLRQLQDYSEAIDGLLPPEAVHVFLWCWIRLYGLLCMEIMNQLAFAYSDMEPVFEECLEEICEKLSIRYERCISQRRGRDAS